MCMYNIYGKKLIKTCGAVKLFELFHHASCFCLRSSLLHVCSSSFCAFSFQWHCPRPPLSMFVFLSILFFFLMLLLFPFTFPFRHFLFHLVSQLFLFLSLYLSPSHSLTFYVCYNWQKNYVRTMAHLYHFSGFSVFVEKSAGPFW